MGRAGLVCGNLHISPRTSSEVIVAFDVSSLEHVAEQEGSEGQRENSGAQFQRENTAMDMCSVSCRDGSEIHIMWLPEQFGN